MIEAWFQASEYTCAPSAPNTDSTDRLAANPVGYTMARAHPFHAARAPSNSRWTGREPVTRRDAPAPAPHRSRARWAACTTSGWDDRPR